LSSEITLPSGADPGTEGKAMWTERKMPSCWKNTRRSPRTSIVDTFRTGNQEVQEKPSTKKLEWGNPGIKNLPVIEVRLFDASPKEHEKQGAGVGWVRRRNAYVWLIKSLEVGQQHST